ncbi:aldose epimerase family protein [Sphingobacterium bovistauri]|uniref:Aldose 1-epimerase n=1 Tax=Sphingobacterium bovistauri TaxID=2781959 RepID=A0ABS7ZD42_9SPHI|nr:aldose epimerase family protein [Sphingobacterium bovistauri]MCA5006659.1 galactose mutarotase [Sphingobacterium bovistauri]
MSTSYKIPEVENFEGNLNGKNTHLFMLKNRAGMQIALTDYGARLVSALVPDKDGNLIDVVLGFDSIDGYLNAQEKYHGATIGRFANRIGNGTFILDGQEYKLPQNNGTNCLHGGPEGYHTKVWDRQVSFRKKVTFYYVSPHNEAGYPGEVNVSVTYELTDNNEILINFRASSDRRAIINLTNHAYFNLNGEGNGDILNHFIQINSNEFIAINENQLPTGQIESVIDSSFDFREQTRVAERIGQENTQLKYANGFDHSYINKNALSQVAASAYSPESGVELELYTDYPTVHLYTGNYLSDDTGKTGKKYLRNGGFCFEAQHHLNNPNQPSFPCFVVDPNKEYNFNMIYKFRIRK